ncbi:MAG: single-stranded-DNA-specific exonuclease RecJ, partial [Moorea sp. SIO3I7]|nr:single-stranded-DNA-specific exonuclease RecJ [Moorena sp. SIO3I7]
SMGFPGIWWGHYQDEVPKVRCNAVVELDYNNYEKRPEVRLVAVQPCQENYLQSCLQVSNQLDWILDCRGQELQGEGLTPLMVYECPTSWDELQVWCRRAIQAERQLAIAYPRPKQLSAQDTWKKLLGIAKFLSRTGQWATLVQLQEKLDLSDRTVELGLNALSAIGFEVSHQDCGVQISWHPKEWSSHGTNVAENDAIALRARCANAIFFAAIEEEQFRRQYFYQVPLSTIAAYNIAGYGMVGIKQD